MIPIKTEELSSADGLVNLPATYNGRHAVALEAQSGDVTFTTLTDAGATSDYQSDGLLDGKIIYGRFDTIHVATGTATIHLKK